MTPTSIHQLRLGLERLSRTHLKSIRGQVKVQPLQALLAVPIPERLTLLCLLDGAQRRTIRQLLKASEEDVSLTSPRMRQAVAALERALNDPLCWVDAGPRVEREPADLTKPDVPFAVVDRLIPRTTERTLRQLFYPASAVMLFGDAAPACIGRLDIRSRLIIYLLLVEHMNWQQAQDMLHCTEWAVRLALGKAKAALDLT